MNKKIKQISFILLLVFSFSHGVYALDPSDVPESASVDVVQDKVRRDLGEAMHKGRRAMPILEIVEEIPPAPNQNDVPFFVESIRFEGKNVLSREELNKFIEPYQNREVTFSDLRKMVHKLEKAFRAKGFFGIVYMPPQKVESGEVVIKAVISKMGNLTVEGSKYYWKWRTKSYWKIPKGDIINYDKVRASLFELNQNPDRLVKPILKAGEEPGTTDVILKTEEHFPIHVGYTFDNQGAKLTGKLRNGFTIRHNNLLTLDDIFIIGTSYARQVGALFLNHQIPVSNFGTKISWSFSHSQVTPKKEFEAFGINAKAQSYGIDIGQRLLRKGPLQIESHVGFNFGEKRTRILSTTAVWDRSRVLSSGIQLQYKDKSGIWAVVQDFSYGFPLQGDGFPLTSSGTEQQFFKYTFIVNRLQKLPMGLTMLASTQGQLSDSRLMPSEKKYLGGAASVRGYPESDYGADQAILSKIEVTSPFFFVPEYWELPFSGKTIREQFSFFGFFDHAYGRINDPTATQRRSRTLASVGGGIKLQFRSNLTARIELGFPVGSHPVGESGSRQLHFKIGADL